MSAPAQQPNLMLRELRERAGLKQRELARRAGVASNTVRNAELGVQPSAASQRRIAAALAKSLAVAHIVETLDRMQDTPELGAELEAQLWPEPSLSLAA